MLRGLRRGIVVEPAFFLATAIVLACGLSFSLAAFSALRAFLYDVPPVARPNELLYVNSMRSNGSVYGLTPPQVDVVSRMEPIFDGVLAHGRDTSLLDTGTGGQSAVLGEMVSGNYFRVLGLSARLGRVFADEDDRPGAAPVVVISEGLWRSHFDANPDVIGSTLRLPPTVVGVTSSPGTPYTIIGVVPRSFHGLMNSWERAQYWVPFSVRARDYICDQPDILTSWQLSVVARVRPNESVEKAKAALAAQGSTLRSMVRSPNTWSLTIRRTRFTSLPFDRAGVVFPERLRDAALIVIAALVAVVVVDLLGLVMARALRRQLDVAVRVALGATKWRVTLAVVREVAIVALIGGGCAIVLAKGLLGLLLASLPANITQGGVGEDGVALSITAGGVIFVLAVCIAIAGVVSVVPVRWAWRVDVQALLSNGVSQQRSGLPIAIQRSILMPLVMLTAMLLTVASAVVQDAASLAKVDLGYQAHGVSVVSFRMRRPPGCQESAGEAAKAVDARRRLISHLLSGLGDDLAHVAVAATAPTVSSKAWVEVRGQGLEADSHYFVTANSVSAHYFDVIKVPLLWGRQFRMADSTDAHPVAIISESLARLITSRGSLASATVAFHEPESMAPAQPLEIVGVVGDTVALNEVAGSRFAVYVPVGQRGVPGVVLTDSYSRGESSSEMSLVDSHDPTLFVNAPVDLESFVSAALRPRLTAAVLLSLFAAAALLFSAVGLYGLVSYSTIQRLRELSIRAAVGATPLAIVRLLLREATMVAAVGVSVGLGAGVLVMSYVSHSLIKLPPVTGAAAAVVGIVVSGTIYIASAIPALRAAAVDPVEALRS
jgi:predicted permease